MLITSSYIENTIALNKDYMREMVLMWNRIGFFFVFVYRKETVFEIVQRDPEPNQSG